MDTSISPQSSNPENEADEKGALVPNRFFFITPHWGWTNNITVSDLTDHMSAEFGTEEFTKEAKEIVKASAPDPYLTASKSKWYSRHRSICLPGQSEDPIAEWKAGIHSGSKSFISFPPSSPVSSHNITLKALRFCGRDEGFVLDSIPYVWKVKNWTSKKFKLCKKLRGQEQEIGRYWPSVTFASGGILVLDTDEVNDVVGIVTCLVMLWKARQRHAERHG
ncbi:hypothetical protein NA57DRAFT_55586 [Rhizodiscina lignyota]|uniref:Uncharacterized protein n=1 Tax=Rhizodiscina lignyota TaxID=1504668 RepID=A0A9P4II23_9PEZI|nr:hypothetical protein NA57DRAFT_55586 [Rhizodiscina lignyota]